MIQIFYTNITPNEPHLDREEIAFLLEDNFTFDEEVEEARAIKRKSLLSKKRLHKPKAI